MGQANSARAACCSGSREPQSVEHVRIHAGCCGAWKELQSDADVRKLIPEGGIPLDKMQLNVPKGTKGAIAVIACGSYSPPTLAHFRILEDAKDQLEVNGYHVVGGIMSPTHVQYGKASLLANYHRINMVGAVLQHSDWVSADPWECSQDGWTETAKVIARYAAEFKKLASKNVINTPVSACLLGGADLIESFAAKKGDGSDVWAPSDVETIVSQGVICIAREGFNLDDVVQKNEILKRNKDRLHVVIPPVENNISSTLIRRNLKDRRSIKYIVHDEVIDYISRHALRQAAQWQ